MDRELDGRGMDPDQDIEQQAGQDNEHKVELYEAGQDDDEVIQDYRQKNPANRPPTANTLRRHAQAQQSQIDSAHDESEEEETQEADDDNSVPKQRARRHSRGVKRLSPDTLAFYPRHWKNVLEDAKSHWHLHIAVKHAFPERTTDLEEASSIINRAIDNYEHKDELEDGIDFFLFSFLSTDLKY